MINWVLVRVAELRSSRGLTLMEIAIVVAIVAAIAAIVMPIALDKVNTARKVSARAEVKSIATAIVTLYNDTTEFPTRKGAERDKIEVLRTGSDSTLDPNFVSEISALWELSEADKLSNHLLVDNPGGVANAYEDNNGAWRGPYIGEVGTDPWGRNYLVIAKGFYDSGTSEAPIYAWVLSAGPNETIETDKDSETLNSDPTTGLTTNSDDIGYLMLSGGI